MTTGRSCLPRQRVAAERCAAAVAARPPVLATDVLAPQEDPRDRWTVEVTLRARAGGLPPEAARAAAATGCTVASVAPQGDGHRAVLVA